jgi:hypothetical protein
VVRSTVVADRRSVVVRSVRAHVAVVHRRAHNVAAAKAVVQSHAVSIRLRVIEFIIGAALRRWSQ